MTPISYEPITAAMGAGDWAVAELLCREQLPKQPEDGNLLLLLAISLQFMQRVDEAVSIYAHLTTLFPDSSLHWGNYATVLRENGDEEAAVHTYATAIRLDPLNISPLINLGLLLLRRQDYIEARKTLLLAHAIDADSPLVRIHAARACNTCKNFEQAEALLKPWRQWLPLDDALQLELSSLQLAMGDGESALTLLEELVRRTPENVLAKIQLVVAYERLNRIADAEVMLAQVTAQQSTLSVETSTEIAHLQAKLALRRGDLALARGLLERLDPRGPTDFAHHFARAEVYDKLGETELVMQTLRVAHAMQMADLAAVQPDGIDLLAQDSPVLPAAVARVSKEEYRTWQPVSAPDAAQSPVFIVGFPRSGTTLLEQMLDAHPGLQSMDENPFFNNLAEGLDDYEVRVPEDLPKFSQRDCDELRKRYLSMVCDTIPRHWNAQLVDKNPLNMLWLPLIHRLFPQAKFILALRHPCDVILSCYMQNFRASVLAAACSTLERLSIAYVSAMESWLHHVEVFKPDVMVLRYEELVNDFPQQAQRIVDFLDLVDATPLIAFDQHARNKGFIGTPSYTQVIQPVNKKGLNRWGRYRTEFEPLLPILEPMLRHWRYSSHPDN